MAADDEILLAVANELAAAEDFESDHWDPEDLGADACRTVELASLAESQDQSLYVWMRHE